MPLSISIPEKEFYDPVSSRFVTVKATKLELEHSLLSISKWEAKWHKPYLTKEQKTNAESVDYVKCMCTNKHIDPMVFYALTKENWKEIADYISDPQTGTTFKNRNKRPSREILTNEVIYFWMTYYNIPFDPCAKWHLNHLMTLIEVCALKNQDPKKMNKRDMLSQRAAENARRRAKYHTKG